MEKGGNFKEKGSQGGKTKGKINTKCMRGKYCVSQEWFSDQYIDPLPSHADILMTEGAAAASGKECRRL